MNPFTKRLWAEVDLDKVEENFRLIRKRLPEHTKLCCVVKANAYGHGAVVLSRLYESVGADFFAVSNIEEAIQLREGGTIKPILILGYTAPECAKELNRYDISQCVYSLSYAEKLQKEAQKNDVKIKIHIKIDTGMGRIGFCVKGDRNEKTELSEALSAAQMQNLIPEGIFTHFAVADEAENGADYTAFQYENFSRAIQYLENRGVSFRLRHCANSAAIFDYTPFSLDMCRAGIVLYGLKPSDAVERLPALQHCMSVKAVVSLVKTLYPGDCVSYGRTFRAQKEMRVATVPCGYADGFRRNNAGKISVLVHGLPAPILGRVCMDQFMIDVSEIPEVSEGDVVTLVGTDGEREVTFDDYARVNATINYEMSCDIAERVPRVYYKGGKELFTVDRLIPQILEKQE